MRKKDNLFGFNKDKLKEWFLYWIVLVAGTFLLLFFITTTWIGVDVRERCLAAQGRYQEDCVTALIKVVGGDTNSLRERNYAIWALGQLGDKRAREVLEKYYTGVIPERESYDNTLSQYEMKKALKLVNGGLNITHLVWNAKQFTRQD